MTSGRGVCLFKEKAGSRKLIKEGLEGSEGAMLDRQENEEELINSSDDSLFSSPPSSPSSPSAVSASGAVYILI